MKDGKINDRPIFPLPLFFNDPRDSQLTMDDFKILALPVSSNKRYYVTISMSVKVKLVLVVKAYSRPHLKDFFGGDLISKYANLLLVDFTDRNVSNVYEKEGSGLEYVVADGDNNTLNMFGTVRSNKETAMLYFGIMPTVYDEIPCKQCKISSNRPCGFCSGNEGTSQDVAMDVSVTAVRYMVDCVNWDWDDDTWDNAGCEISVGFAIHTYRVRIMTAILVSVYVYYSHSIAHVNPFTISL